MKSTDFNYASELILVLLLLLQMLPLLLLLLCVCLSVFFMFVLLKSVFIFNGATWCREAQQKTKQ